jgi:hypothetical protein
LVVLLGCSNDPGPLANESAGGELSLEDPELEIGEVALPHLPHGISVERPPLEEGVRLARASGDVLRPTLDESTDLAGVQAYVEGPLREWMLLRGRALREVRSAFDEIDHGTNVEDGEVVVAAAVLGVLYLRLALEIAELPLPEAVRSNPSERLQIRNALLAAARPLFNGAQGAFAACVENAVRSADPSVEPWERFCDGAAADAEDAPRPIDEASPSPAADDTEEAEPSDARDDDDA